MKKPNTFVNLTQSLIRYLNCPCQSFEPMEDDDPIQNAYRQARDRGAREGFLPVLVVVNETLWECLVMNSGQDSDADDFAFDPGAVANYRNAMLSAPLKSGRLVLDHLTGVRREETSEDDMDWDEEILGEMAGGEAIDRFCGYWDYSTKKTYPLVLAEIPVSHPWEIFAWLPFGGWNECPDTPELMAVSKYWFELYGAVTAVITHDVLEYSLPAPAVDDAAVKLALEHYAWCPDVVDQGSEDGTVGTLADTLRQSTIWYFWWD